MRADEFAVWLENNYKTKHSARLQPRPQSDAKSRCERVERYEGDLDTHFAQDRMKSLMNALTYSRADERDGVSIRHRVPIDGDVVNGTASLKSAANLYRLYCQDHPPKTK